MKIENQIDSEKLFYKLILQFSIFSSGLNKRLDPHLLNISKSLKQGVNFQNLTPELRAISNTLAQIQPPVNQINNVNASTTNLLTLKEFVNRLILLLAETEIPLKFRRQQALIAQKSNTELNEKDANKVIDLALALLIDIKNYAISEQQSLEQFLANMSIQFDKLEGHALRVSNTNKQSIENRQSFNKAINQEVNSIKESSENAENLNSLQEQINSHLKELRLHLFNHQKSEIDRELETNSQLDQMSQQLKDMEIEADTLRNKLQIAHDNALRDKLTEIPNRMAYDDRASLEYNRWRRYRHPLALIIWDIDLFKSINDNYGHKAGDKTLTLVAQLIQKSCRETDFIARYGGEEFVMLLPNTTAEQALIAANKTRELIAKSGFNHQGQSIKLTISCGISEFFEGDEHSTVFERADQALYLSKEHGRNKCTIKKQ